MLLNLFAAMTLFMPVSIQSFLWNDQKDSQEVEDIGAKNIEETDQEFTSLNHAIQEIMFLLIDDRNETKKETLPVTIGESSRTATDELVEERTLTPEEEQAQALADWKATLPQYEEATTQTEFIQKVAPAAVLIAQAHGIYPSVMIAQAALESSWGKSGLAETYNNLMGTKGSTEGKSVTVRTREDQNGESVYINAGFTVYDSWGHSLFHYGSLMKNGLSWDSDYYSGVWRENTNTYEDATAWLQGRYASDTAYASKLNQTIDSFNLTQYDEVSPFEYDLETTLSKLALAQQ